MLSDPREVHDFDQFGARIKEMARHVAAYRAALVEAGVPKTEAWVSAQRIEERWADVLFSEMEDRRKRRMVDEILDEIRWAIEEAQRGEEWRE